MKICFFGYKDAFDPARVGGTESYIRRLKNGLCSLGCEVDYVMYGTAKRPKKLDGSTLHYLKEYKNCKTQIINGNYDIVITVYLHPKYRMDYYFFRSKTIDTKFGYILYSPIKNSIKWLLAKQDLKSYDFVFSVSPRIENNLTKAHINNMLITPPVSEIFSSPMSNTEDKNQKTRIGFIGRSDYGKGFDIAVELINKFTKIGYSGEVRTYAWDKSNSLLRDALECTCKSEVEVKVLKVSSYDDSVENEIAGFLANLDFLLLPYRTLETTIDVPLALVEGIVSGCVVITSDMPEIIDVVNRWFSSAYNIELIHDWKDHTKLKKVFSSQRRANGNLKANELFRPNTVAKEILRYIGIDVGGD